MDWITTIIAGITGTILMTAFIHAWTYLTGFEYRVPNILGTLITMSTKPSGKLSEHMPVIITGYFFHFLTGILFSFIYYFLWDYYLGQPEWADILLLGCASGFAAVAIWYNLLRLHPLTPRLKRKSYLLLVFLGHFVFTAGVIASWKIKAGL